MPRDGKPITTWANFDEAYTDVAQQVRNVVESGTSREDLSVHHDDQMLILKPLGMSFHGSSEHKLSIQQAAEHYWEMLISSMQ